MTVSKIQTDQSLLTEILNHLGPMIWTKDIKTGQVSFLTENFSEVFGLPMDLIRLEPSVLKKAIHKEDLPFVDLFSKVLLSNQFEQLEYRIVVPGEKMKWILERKQLVKNEKGEIIRLNVFLLDITSQKEEALLVAQSESVHKELFFRHPGPMWVYDTENLNFLAVNDAAVKFYGYTRGEFEKMTVRQIRPKEDIPELLSAIRENNFQEHQGKKWKHIRKDGSRVSVRLFSNAVNFMGRPARLVLATDISGQVEAESGVDKARRHLERYQEAVSQHSLLALMDETGNLLHVNENLLRKTGLSAEGVKGKNWSELISYPHAGNQIRAEIREQISRGSIWRKECKLRRSGGNALWVNCTIVPIFKDEDRETQLFLFIADDISGYKEAEKQNKAYIQRIKNILEGITDPIFVLDKKWLFTNSNAEAERLLEKKANEMQGKNIWEIFPPEEGFRFYQFFRKAKRKRVIVEFEEFYSPKNRWYGISIYPSADGLVVCFRDITDRRGKDFEMKQLMDQLMVQNRDLEEFTYITSHSLRAHIANISMLCSAMDPGGLTPRNQEIFERVFQASGNLTTVISDLNTILTVKNRKAYLVEKISVQNAFVNSVARIPAEYAAFKKHIRTSFGEVSELHSVRNHIETILFQLLVNAIRFRSLSEELSIDVSSGRKGNQIFLKIQDNGRGIDLEKAGNQIGKLYKTFCPGVSGKGMGLYLCRLLTESLGGKMELDSSLGEGTAVTIYLPKKYRNS
jgi:PAS domain S-box-containing protein